MATVFRAPLFSRSTPRARSEAFIAPNIPILAASQAKVKPVGRAQNEQLTAPKQRLHEFVPPNIPLRVLAQSRVHPVGSATPDARPAIQQRVQDVVLPNLLATRVTAAPFTNEFYDRPPVAGRVQDALPPNIPVLAAAQAQVEPIGTAAIEATPTTVRAREFLYPNLLAIQPVAGVPFTNEVFDRPAPQFRQQDALFPNLALARAPFVSPIFDAPRPVQNRVDFQFRNVVALAAAQLQVAPVGEALTETKPTYLRGRDFLFPNLLIVQPAGGPFGNEYFDCPPLAAYPADVLLPPNIVALSAAQLQVKPVGTVLTETTPAVIRARDFLYPNLLTVQPVTGVPFSNEFFDRPRIAARQIDLLPVNLPALNAAQLQVKPFFNAAGFDRPIATSVSRDAPLPNLLTTTLATVVVKPPFNLVVERRPVPVAPQDAAPPNILVTTLATVQGTPVASPFLLFTTRPLTRVTDWRPDFLPSNIVLPSAPVVPVTPPTGGGERLPRGYRWNWRDFTDREWVKAFRQEFRRLKHLKNPQDRREQIEALEEALERAVDRALSNETPQEIMVGLEKAGEMLLGAPELGAPAFERIEMYLVALAAEIDDEEAFLLLGS